METLSLRKKIFDKTEVKRNKREKHTTKSCNDRHNLFCFPVKKTRNI